MRGMGYRHSRSPNGVFGSDLAIFSLAFGHMEGDLGHLDGDVAAVVHDLGTDLDQTSPED